MELKLLIKSCKRFLSAVAEICGYVNEPVFSTRVTLQQQREKDEVTDIFKASYWRYNNHCSTQVGWSELNSGRLQAHWPMHTDRHMPGTAMMLGMKQHQQENNKKHAQTKRDQTSD